MPRAQPPGGGIELQALLKVLGWAPTGGQAKRLIQSGSVRVNGVVETRRGRKLHRGDRVATGDHAPVTIE